MRHGAAASKGPYADADRPLTAEGQEQIECAARALKRLAFAPRILLTTPAERCRHSATMIAEVLGVQASAVRSIEPGPTRVLHTLAHLGEVDCVLVIGHEPDLVDLASILLAGTCEVTLHFRASSIACFEVDGLPPSRPAVLQWFLDPAALRSIGRPN
jgi:phosphohistidine phosphatase SixA